MNGSALVLVCFLWASPVPAENPSPAPSASPEVVTKERALAVARAKLAEVKRDAEFVIVESRTVERPFGWVFFYEPRKSVAAGDPSSVVPGAGPLVVLKEGGGTAFLSTSVPPDQAIAEYEKAWRRREERKQKP
ncbi:MAG: YrhB domain-containing protein [Vicinamibacteria bacterium]